MCFKEWSALSNSPVTQLVISMVIYIYIYIYILIDNVFLLVGMVGKKLSIELGKLTPNAYLPLHQEFISLIEFLLNIEMTNKQRMQSPET